MCDTVQERIRELRQKKGYTLHEVAEYIGTTEPTIYRYETGNGIKNVPPQVVEKLAVLYNVTPAYLMGWQSGDEKREDEVNVHPRVLDFYYQWNDALDEDFTPGERRKIAEYARMLISARPESGADK